MLIFTLFISLSGVGREEERKRSRATTVTPQTAFNVAIKQRISATTSKEHKIVHTDGIAFHSVRFQASLRLISV